MKHLKTSFVLLIPDVPTSFGEFNQKYLNITFKKSWKFVYILDLPSIWRTFGKNFQSLKGEKKSWKFVYILAKQWRSHFHLTKFFDKKF